MKIRDITAKLKKCRDIGAAVEALRDLKCQYLGAGVNSNVYAISAGWVVKVSRNVSMDDCFALPTLHDDVAEDIKHFQPHIHVTKREHFIFAFQRKAKIPETYEERTKGDAANLRFDLCQKLEYKVDKSPQHDWSSRLDLHTGNFGTVAGTFKFIDW